MVTTSVGEFVLPRLGIYSVANKSDGGAASRHSDKFVEAALKLKKYKGIKFQVTADKITGMLPPGSTGVNHGMTLPCYATLLFNISLR